MLAIIGLCVFCHSMRHICCTTDVFYLILQPKADPCNCHLKVYLHPELLELPKWEALRADLGPNNFDTIGERGPLSSDSITPGAIGTGLHGFMSDGPLGDKRHYERQSIPGPQAAADS
jgi:hypothetical protein